MEHTFPVWDELIKSLIVLNDRETLQEVWHTFHPNEALIRTNETLGQFYALSLPTLYPLPDSLLKLYQWRDHFQTQNWDLSHIDELIQNLNQQQLQQQQLQDAIASDTVDLFLASLTAHPYQLLQFLKQAYQLDLQTVLPFYLAVMRQTTIAQYIKSDVLHYLHFNDYKQPVSYQWFDELREVNLAQLAPYQLQTSYRENCEQIELYGEQFNPHLVFDLIQQLTLHYLTLYPYFDEIYPEATQWLHLFLTENNLDSPYACAISSTQSSCFQQVTTELHNLFFA